MWIPWVLRGSSQTVLTGMLLERRGQYSGHQMGSMKRFPKGKADICPSHMLVDASQPGLAVSVTVNNFHCFSHLLEFNVVQIKRWVYSHHGALCCPLLGLTYLCKWEGNRALPERC